MLSRVLPVLAAVLALPACGTSDDRAQARATTERFAAALRSHDGSAACGQLTAAARQQLASQSGQSCRAVITRLKLSDGPVRRVEVFVTNARVELGGQESAYLDREPQGWRLSALGCKPQQGKPRDRPLNCEVQA